MVPINRYGPVLDTATYLIRELTRDGIAELRVPVHPEAAGMAADVHHHLLSLYVYTDSEIYRNTARPLLVAGKQDDVGAKRYRVRVVFDKNAPFEMPEMSEFSLYLPQTIIDLDDEGKQTLKSANPQSDPFKSAIGVSAVNTPTKYSRMPDRFIAALRRTGIELPPETNLITNHFSYQSVSPFPCNTFFQFFDPVNRFIREQARKEGSGFPVSSMGTHKVDYESWKFFNMPVFWDSWSQFGSIALNKMAGIHSYEEAARYYSRDIDTIERHASKAESAVVSMLEAMKAKRNPSEVADSVGCPPEYRGLYLRKTLSTKRWLCNPDSLNDPEKRRYLEILAESCKEYGFDITPQQLAFL